MHEESGFSALIRSFSGQGGLVVRITATLASGLLLSAAALVGLWCLSSVLPPSVQGIFAYRRIDDEEIAVALALASFAWIAAIIRIWQPQDGARQAWYGRLARPLLLNVAWVVATALLSVAIDQVVQQQEELLIAAVWLAAGAAAVVCWLPAFQAIFVGRPVVGEDKQVNVHCPACGYLLVGLKELRCPECGVNFTIDELIRAQNYAGQVYAPAAKRDSAAVRLVDSGAA